MRKLNTKAIASTATIAPVAKPARTVTTKPGKPANTAKPATPDKANARSERQAVLGKHRDHVATFYAGASLTAHKHKAAPLDLYISRATKPTQCVNPATGTTERDHSLLALIFANSKAGTFDPVALGADAGVISRLASVAFIAYDAKASAFILTAAGTERAKLITRKQA